MADPILNLENVHLTLTGGSGDVHILKGINLQVARGETVSIVGPSGSGKTSLLMVIAGLEAPTSGKVELEGSNLGGLDEDRLARIRREKIGIVFQSFHLVPTMTALENAALPLEFSGRTDSRTEAEKSLKAAGLEQRMAHYPGELSGGEQQRVALARAMVAAPALLLADEPTGNLDSETGAMIMDLLFDMQVRHGTTLLLVTHDQNLAGRCNRSIRMVDGRLVGAPP